MKTIKAIRSWLCARRIRRLRVVQAALLGKLRGYYAAGYTNPNVEGQLARVDEQLRQLEAA